MTFPCFLLWLGSWIKFHPHGNKPCFSGCFVKEAPGKPIDSPTLPPWNMATRSRRGCFLGVRFPPASCPPPLKNFPHDRRVPNPFRIYPKSWRSWRGKTARKGTFVASPESHPFFLDGENHSSPWCLNSTRMGLFPSSQAFRGMGQEVPTVGRGPPAPPYKRIWWSPCN